MSDTPFTFDQPRPAPSRQRVHRFAAHARVAVLLLMAVLVLTVLLYPPQLEVTSMPVPAAFTSWNQNRDVEAVRQHFMTVSRPVGRSGRFDPNSRTTGERIHNETDVARLLAECSLVIGCGVLAYTLLRNGW